MAAVAAVPGERGGVGVPADQEEDRHHLEQPGEGLDPRHHVQEVATAELAVGDGDDADQPVPENHHEDGERAQSIDIAVPVRGRGVGQLLDPG